MLTAERNALITQTGLGTPLGVIMRQYWQPAALVDELDGARPVRPVRLLGENLVLFRDPLWGAVNMRPDGRAVHDMHSYRVKTPTESRGRSDGDVLVATIPGEQAFRPLDQGGCALVH